MEPEDRRLAVIRALSDELGRDADEAFLALVDRFLTRLYLFGYIVTEAEDEE